MNLFETEFEREQRIFQKKRTKSLVIILIFVGVVLASLFLIKDNLSDVCLSCWFR